MVADFVRQHVRDQIGQADIAAFDPLIEEGAPVEKHDRHCRGGVGDGLLGQIDAVIEPA